MSRNDVPAKPVRVGQIWADNDTRCRGRTLKVVELNLCVDSPFAVCEVVTDAEGSPTRAVGRRTKISLKRLKPTSTGYRLLIDENGQPVGLR